MNYQIFKAQIVGTVEVEYVAGVAINRGKRQGIAVAINRNGIGRRHSGNFPNFNLLDKGSGIRQNLKHHRPGYSARGGCKSCGKSWIRSATTDGVGACRKVGQGRDLNGSRRGA